MVRNGFSLHDVEKLYEEYDYRAYKAIIAECLKQEKVERLAAKLASAEAFNFAYGGSKTKKGYSSFGKWQRNIVNQINRLNGIKQTTFWEKKRRRSFKF